MPEKKRLGFIDLAKAIAFMMVVCGHTFVPGSRLRAIIYSFHMPLFFILAGYTFRTKSQKTAVVTSAKRLLLPYALAYTTVTVIPSVLIWTQERRFAKLISLLKSFVYTTGDGHVIESTGAFWFLVALFFSRIIFNALLLVLEKHDASTLVQGIVCGAVATLSYVLGGVFTIWLPMALDIALMGVFFMWSGYAMRQTGIVERKMNPLLLIIPFAIWAGEIATGLPGWNQPLSMLGRTYNAFPLAVFGAICASFLLIKACHSIEAVFGEQPDRSIPKRILSSGEWVGRMCMKLYLIHCFDFYLSWDSIGIPLLGSTSLFATLARLSFDILVLLLFSIL